MKELLAYVDATFGAKKLGEITWSHAVNSQEKLERTIDDPQIMFVESDIRLSADGTIITAHPPETESDLSFTALINTLKTSDKGLKLDFKDPEVLAVCLAVLKNTNLSQPVLLNAGILQGLGAPTPKFEGVGFIGTCRREYPQGILSVDWSSVNVPGSYYSEKNIDDMQHLCVGIDEITFPVRALYLPNSWNQLQRLLKEEGRSLSIWNNEEVDDQLKDWIRENTDPEKTMYDFIDPESRESVRLW